MRARAWLSDAVLTFVLLAAFVAGLAMSFGWPYQAALFPRMITGAGIVLALAQLVRSALAARPGPPAMSGPPAVSGQEGEHEPGEEGAPREVGYVFADASAKTWMATLGWLGLFFVVLWTLGIIAAFVVFTLPYLYVAGGSRPWVAVVYTAAFVAVFYLAFVGLLKVPIPGGLA